MIVDCNCKICNDKCCKKASIMLNTVDLAKILYAFKDCKYKALSSGPDFGAIYYKKNAIAKFRISKISLLPCIETYMPAPCKFFNDNELCDLHDLVVDEDSKLGKWLEKYKLPKEVKPMICRHHPYFYDPRTDTVKKLKVCQKFDKKDIIEAVACENKDLQKEARTISNIEALLLVYWRMMNENRVMWLAEALINWKRKDPIKYLENKLGIY